MDALLVKPYSVLILSQIQARLSWIVPLIPYMIENQICVIVLGFVMNVKLELIIE